MKHIFILDSDMINYNALFRFRELLSTMVNFEYLVFTTEYSLHEIELTKRMCNIFNDEEIRFYCYGDVRTLGNMISSVPDMSMVEFTIIPSECTVDLLKNFNDPRNSFKSLESLINGKVEYIDYIDMGPNLRSMNSVFVGLGAIGKHISFSTDYNLSHSIDKFMRKLSLNLSNILYIINHHPRDYKVTIDGKNYDGKYSFILFQNGNYSNRSLKFFDDSSLINGQLSIMLIKKVSLRQLLKIYSWVKKRQYEKLKPYVTCLQGKNFVIETTDSEDLSFVIDGIKHELPAIQGEIKRKALKFVIPKSASLAD